MSQGTAKDHQPLSTSVVPDRSYNIIFGERGEIKSTNFERLLRAVIDILHMLLHKIDPFFGPGAKNPSIGQVLLMSKEQLQNRILTDPHVQIYPCGRRDIQAGTIDRRILATLEFLSSSGLDPYISGLACGANTTASTYGLFSNPQANLARNVEFSLRFKF
jgi:hypothetical protein